MFDSYVYVVIYIDVDNTGYLHMGRKDASIQSLPFHVVTQLWNAYFSLLHSLLLVVTSVAPYH
jgi:hypothetical protein